MTNKIITAFGADKADIIVVPAVSYSWSVSKDKNINRSNSFAKIINC